MSAIAGLGVAFGWALAGAAEQPPEALTLPELASEFRQWRAIKGHFEGGSWRQDVDGWTGRKHRIMEALRQAIDARNLMRSQLVEHMGTADNILRSEDPLYSEIVRNGQPCGHKNSSVEILLYAWRGSHDWLYFVTLGEAICHSGWWHAGE